MSLKKSIAQILSSNKLRISTILISGLLIAIGTTIIPRFIGDVFSRNLENIFIPLLGVSIGYILRAVFKLVRNHVSASLGTEVVLNLRAQVCEKVLTNKKHLSEQEVSKYFTIISYDLETVSNVISHQSFVFIENILVLIFSLIQILQINLVLFLLIIPFLLAITALSFLYARKIDVLTGKIRTSLVKVGASIRETLLVQKLIRAQVAQAAFEQKFDDANNDNYTLNFSRNKKGIIFVPIIEILSYLAMFMCIGFGSYIIIRNDLDIGLLVAFYGYMTLLVATAAGTSNIINFYVDSKQGLQRTNELFSFEEQDNQMIPEHNISHIEALEVECDNFSINFEKGKVYCISGRTGSGKSSIANAIVGLDDRFYRVNINHNASIKNMRLALHNLFGYAMQKQTFFHDTIKNNILLGRQSENNEKYKHILEFCGVNDIIGSLELNEETLINKDSVFLSGGEKQRICIARALLQNPDVIILDDCITAIDRARRDVILREIKKTYSNKIVIVISNYPFIQDFADCVYDLSELRGGE